MLNPSILPAHSCPATFCTENGELFVTSPGAADETWLTDEENVDDADLEELDPLPVTLDATPLELEPEVAVADNCVELWVVVYVLPAESVVVIVWTITPAAPPVPPLLDCVYVDTTVVALPAEFVVVNVLAAPGAVV